MAKKRERFYRLMIAYFSEHTGDVGWDLHNTWDTQPEAYKAMAEYREYYSDDETPLRIVRVDAGEFPGDPDDETFIDETGMSVSAWTDKARAEALALGEEER